ncbi:MAG: hypothetical protein ABI603_02380 [Acidobacteriota bacterium]
MAILLLASSAAWADSPSVSDLQKRVKALERQVVEGAATDQELQRAEVELRAAQAKAADAQGVNGPVATVNPTPSSGDRLINFHLSGVVVADFMATDATRSHNSFVGGKFLPIFLASYSNWFLFEGHMEVSSTPDGGTDTSLEYSQLDFLVNDNLTIVAGRFLSPIGQFQQALHPPWINKLPNRPAGFVEDGGDEPLSEVGIMARGGFPIGSMTGTYAVYVGNGPRMGDAGPVLAAFANDNNGNKAVGGRVSIFLLPHLEFGLSEMHARVDGSGAMSGSVSQAGYQLVDADVGITLGNWDVRGEYLRSHLGAIMSALDPADDTPMAIEATTWKNGYVQAAYRLARVSNNPIVQKLEPVVGYSQLRVDGFAGFAENAENRWTAGLDCWLAPSMVAKIAYEHRQFSHRATVNAVRAQVAFGF